MKKVHDPFVGDVFAFFAKWRQVCIKLLQWHEDGVALVEYCGSHAKRIAGILRARAAFG